ncbi:helix-turn-helix domain-containing protein [Cellulosimicrobium cellulans]|uniref:helix-turn-helix domain-containing protein n=1 Tax=Cellulosimicrobium cellulans TaxID=1710 RepID=UPI001143B0D6|nr:helix-turn-helix transcriptional regulator [Cellulosimicrobium cellulans]
MRAHTRRWAKIDQVNPPPDETSSVSDEAIRETIATGTLDDIEDLSDLLWYDLPGRFALPIMRRVRGLDATEFENRPRLLYAALLAHHRAEIGERDSELRKILNMFAAQGRSYATRLTSFTRPSDLITAGTIAVVSARLRGAYEESERLGTWVDKQLVLTGSGHTLPWTTAHVATKPGWLSAERGTTAMLAGRLDHAAKLYTRAHLEAGPPPHAHHAGANALANLALVAAYRGHLDLARTWLTALDDSAAGPQWIEHLTTVGATVARALVAIEEADPDEARQHLDAVGPATQSLELWPFIAYAHSSHAALFDDPHAALAHLDEARTRHGALEPDPTTLAGQLVLRSEAKLLLKAAEGNRLLQLVDTYPDVAFLRQHAAWAHLLAGHPHEAIRATAQALHQLHIPVPDMMGMHLVLAVAHLRTGNKHHAATAFRKAVRLRTSDNHVKPFLAADPDDLNHLAELAKVPNPLLNRQLRRVNVPRGVEVVRLTPRETAVLTALAAGDTAERAATQFGVSPATVRTQIRSIYRKLGVSRRAAALARAEELGLLHDTTD